MQIFSDAQILVDQLRVIINLLRELIDRMPTLPTVKQEGVVEIDCSDQGRIMHHLEKALDIAKASYPKTALRIEFAMHSFRE